MICMNNKMSKTAVELFLGLRVEDIHSEDGVPVFTANGLPGELRPGIAGGLDIFLAGQLMYCVESAVMPLLGYSDELNLFALYEYVKNIQEDQLQELSGTFVQIVRRSIEKLLLDGNMPLLGTARIGDKEVIYTEDKRFIFCLN